MIVPDWYPSRFTAKVVVSDDGCWLWTAHIRRDGYGSFWFEGQMRSAHRFAYTAAIGPIPEGLQLDHLCRIRRCVNPAHLEPVTHTENVRRSDAALGRGGAKTHCRSGHPFDELNTRRDLGGSRHCRTCDREYARRSGELRRTA